MLCSFYRCLGIRTFIPILGCNFIDAGVGNGGWMFTLEVAEVIVENVSIQI